MPIAIIKIEEEGNDLVINDSVSVPKSQIIISKREDFCTFTFPKRYYSQDTKHMEDSFEIRWDVIQEPTATSNEDLFKELIKLKK